MPLSTLNTGGTGGAQSTRTMGLQVLPQQRCNIYSIDRLAECNLEAKRIKISLTLLKNS